MSVKRVKKISLCNRYFFHPLVLKTELGNKCSPLFGDFPLFGYSSLLDTTLQKDLWWAGGCQLSLRGGDLLLGFAEALPPDPYLPNFSWNLLIWCHLQGVNPTSIDNKWNSQITNNLFVSIIDASPVSNFHPKLFWPCIVAPYRIVMTSRCCNVVHPPNLQLPTKTDSSSTPNDVSINPSPTVAPVLANIGGATLANILALLVTHYVEPGICWKGNEHFIRLIRITGVMVCCAEGGEDRVASGQEYFVVAFAQLDYWCRHIMRKAVAERYYQFTAECYSTVLDFWCGKSQRKAIVQSYCGKLLQNGKLL